VLGLELEEVEEAPQVSSPTEPSTVNAVAGEPMACLLRLKSVWKAFTLTAFTTLVIAPGSQLNGLGNAGVASTSNACATQDKIWLMSAGL
jgi:hypothetical protein